MTFEDALNQSQIADNDVGPEIVWSRLNRSNRFKTRIMRACIFELSLREHLKVIRPWFLEVTEQAFNELVFDITPERFQSLPRIITRQAWNDSVAEALAWLRAEMERAEHNAKVIYARKENTHRNEGLVCNTQTGS